MPESQHMGITYPEDGADPWYTAFEGMVTALDSQDFAAFEDRNIFVTGGGDFVWDASTGLLTWAGTVALSTPSSGLLQSLATGSATIEDGEHLLVDVARGSSASVTLTADVSTVIEPSTNTIALALRIGDLLVFRNHRIMDDGDTLAVFEDADGAALAAHVAAADPHVGYQKESEKAAAGGYASLDGSTLVPAAQIPTATTAARGGVIIATEGEETNGEPVNSTDQRVTRAALIWMGW